MTGNDIYGSGSKFGVTGSDQEAFPPICDCDLEILFLNGSPGQNIWVHKILPRYPKNSVSEVDPRLKKKRKFGVSQPIKLICVNYRIQ